LDKKLKKKMDKVVKDDREARLWNYFTRQDDFWPIREWPAWAQEVALMSHKNYRERYRLFLFWTFNGLNPNTAAGWLYMRDYRHPTPLAGDYDRSATSQINGMIKQAQRGTLFERDKRSATFDMILGRPD